MESVDRSARIDNALDRSLTIAIMMHGGEEQVAHHGG
jgi:hypothetical protein